MFSVSMFFFPRRVTVYVTRCVLVQRVNTLAQSQIKFSNTPMLQSGSAYARSHTGQGDRHPEPDSSLCISVPEQDKSRMYEGGHDSQNKDDLTCVEGWS